MPLGIVVWLLPQYSRFVSRKRGEKERNDQPPVLASSLLTPYCQQASDFLFLILHRHNFLKAPFGKEVHTGLIVNMQVYFAVQNVPKKLEYG